MHAVLMHAVIEYLNQPHHQTRIDLFIWNGDELVRVYRDILSKSEALAIAQQHGAEVV